MIKGKHIQQAFDGFVWLFGVGGVGSQPLATSVKTDDQPDTIVINNNERKDLAF